MSLDEVVRSAFSRAGIVRVRSALNPFLWTVPWAIIFLVAAYFFGSDPYAKYGLLILAALPVLVTLGVGLFFAFTDPNRLQSEEFVTRQHELTMIERKGWPMPPAGQIKADPDVANVPSNDREQRS